MSKIATLTVTCLDPQTGEEVEKRKYLVRSPTAMDLMAGRSRVIQAFRKYGENVPEDPEEFSAAFEQWHAEQSLLGDASIPLQSVLADTVFTPLEGAAPMSDTVVNYSLPFDQMQEYIRAVAFFGGRAQNNLAAPKASPKNSSGAQNDKKTGARRTASGRSSAKTKRART